MKHIRHHSKIPTDSSLLSRLRRSDRTVINDLYHKYAPELRLWLGQVHSFEDCEDLIADALNNAWTTRTSIRKNVKECLLQCLRRAVEEDDRYEWRGKMWVMESWPVSVRAMIERIERDDLFDPWLKELS